MPVKYVQVLHDDVHWHEAELLDQHRSHGRWRAVVRYSVSPGMQYERGVWADSLRAVAEPQDYQQDNARRGHRDADSEDHPT